jgi:DNA-directed RNA polymerase I subunit RPA43
VDAQQPVAKKSKHSSRKEEKKDKTTRHRHHHESRHSKDDVGSGEFQVISSTLVVSIPPLYASNPRLGVQEMLDGMLMRYAHVVNPYPSHLIC